MKANLRIISLAIFLFLSGAFYSQAPDENLLKPDPAREAMFRPYLAARHGGPQQLDAWKASNTVQYYRELWYFCESFRVARKHLAEGLDLNESIIDITRFEHARKNDEEAIVILPGFKDALVLLPASKLAYKPDYAK